MEKLDDLINVLSEFALTKAVFEPLIGGALQIAETLDATRAALTAGDIGTVANELVNLPARVANALLNGITPAGTTTQWQGLIRGGLGTFLLVTLPNQIAAALTPPVEVNNTFADFGPTGLNFGGGDLLTINTGLEGDGEGSGSGELSAGTGLGLWQQQDKYEATAPSETRGPSFVWGLSGISK